MGLLDDAIREHLDLKRRSGADPAEIERLEREALGPVRREPSVAGTAVEIPPEAPAIADTDAHVDEPHDDEDVPRASIVGIEDQPQPKRRGFLHRRPSSLASPPAGAEEQITHPDTHDEVAAHPDEHDHLATQSDEHAPDEKGADEAAADTQAHEPPAAAPAEEKEPPHLTFEGKAPAPPAPRHPLDAPPPAPAREPEAEPEPEAAQSSDADAGLTDTSEYDVAEALEKEGEDEDVLEETPEFLQDTPDHDRLWFEQRPPKDFDFDG
jgi:hypothetical protein